MLVSGLAGSWCPADFPRSGETFRLTATLGQVEVTPGQAPPPSHSPIWEVMTMATVKHPDYAEARRQAEPRFDDWLRQVARAVNSWFHLTGRDEGGR